MTIHRLKVRPVDQEEEMAIAKGGFDHQGNHRHDARDNENETRLLEKVLRFA